MPSSAQQKQFINSIGYIIQEEAKQRGYNFPSAILAMACLESNYGVSLLSARWFNFFGMKCGSAWKGESVNLATKEEYTVGTLTSIRDNFRVYKSMEEGVIGFFDFISTKRYSNLKNATSAREFLEMIKADGYCTSSTYVSSCMNIISRHDLERYDSEIIPFGNPYTLTDELLKKGSKGESVKWLQWELDSKGYPLNVDGIYGPKTEAAVRQFQMDVFVDGVVGPDTLGKLRK